MINLKETKRIKDALAKNPADYKKIIEDTALAICITNKDAKFVAVNNNYVSLYGFSREELIGKPFTVVVPKENQQALASYHKQFFETKYEILRMWVVQKKSGEYMQIFADAGYSDKIENQPCKITLINFEKMVPKAETTKGDYANNKV
jgi:two-component system CheB/CheR fusion protein